MSTPGGPAPPPCSNSPTRSPHATCRRPLVVASAGARCRWPASSGGIGRQLAHLPGRLRKARREPALARLPPTVHVGIHCERPALSPARFNRGEEHPIRAGRVAPGRGIAREHHGRRFRVGDSLRSASSWVGVHFTLTNLRWTGRFRARTKSCRGQDSNLRCRPLE